MITVRHGEHGGLRALRHRLEDEPDLLALGPSAVLYAVADQVVDDYRGGRRRRQEDVDEVEIDVSSADEPRATTSAGSTSSSGS